jgi:hypothetical protein
VRVAKTASATYSIARVGGFTGAVSVTAEKLAAFDATLTLSASTLSGSTASTDLRVAAGRNAVAGTYPVRVRFTSGSLVHDVTVNVTVTKH